MKEIIEILSAALAPITAIVALTIAYRQYRLEQVKFRHELYEKRLAIYNSTMRLFSNISRTGKIEFEELIQFLRETNQSRFLLGRDISNYLDELYKKGVDLECQNTMLHGPGSLPVGEERTRLAHENAELKKWFGNQFSIAQEKFSIHLGLDK